MIFFFFAFLFSFHVSCSFIGNLLSQSCSFFSFLYVILLFFSYFLSSQFSISYRLVVLFYLLFFCLAFVCFFFLFFFFFACFDGHVCFIFPLLSKSCFVPVFHLIRTVLIFFFSFFFYYILSLLYNFPLLFTPSHLFIFLCFLP